MLLCRFDGDICTTLQVPFDTQEWPSGVLPNKSMTLPLCPQRQIADSWILFKLGASPLCDEPIGAVLQGFNSETVSGVRRGKQQSIKLGPSMKTALQYVQMVYWFELTSLYIKSSHGIY